MGSSKSNQRQQQAGHVPGAAIVAGVFVALLILFLWLHFIVAHENEMIGREIQLQTEELARIERENMALRRQVAAVYAEPAIAARARALGYQAQQPLYLLLSHPLLPAARGARSMAPLLPSIYGSVSPATGEASPPLQAGGDDSTITAVGRP